MFHSLDMLLCAVADQAPSPRHLWRGGSGVGGGDWALPVRAAALAQPPTAG
jgi:hypothetical protein